MSGPRSRCSRLAQKVLLAIQLADPQSKGFPKNSVPFPGRRGKSEDCSASRAGVPGVGWGAEDRDIGVQKTVAWGLGQRLSGTGYAVVWSLQT